MKQSIKIFIALFAVAIGFSSCLKDDTLIHPDNTISNIVEFYNNTPITSNTSSIYPVYTPMTLDVVPEAEFDVVVSYSGVDVAPQDITVSLAADPNVVTEYNAKHGTAYNALAASTFTLPASVVIKKGERKATVKVKVNPDKFDGSKENVLPLKITGASQGTVSGNFGTAIFSLPVKSIFEGTYTVHEKITGATNEDFEEHGVALTTVGPNKLTTQYVGQWFSGNTTYTFNNDGTISVSAFSGSQLTVTVLDSHYDVNTKNFYVKWSISAGPRTFEETWTRE